MFHDVLTYSVLSYFYYLSTWFNWNMEIRILLSWRELHLWFVRNVQLTYLTACYICDSIYYVSHKATQLVRIHWIAFWTYQRFDYCYKSCCLLSFLFIYHDTDNFIIVSLMLNKLAYSDYHVIIVCYWLRYRYSVSRWNFSPTTEVLTVQDTFCYFLPCHVNYPSDISYHMKHYLTKKDEKKTRDLGHGSSDVKIMYIFIYIYWFLVK